jgi:hypothetical protein
MVYCAATGSQYQVYVKLCLIRPLDMPGFGLRLGAGRGRRRERGQNKSAQAGAFCFLSRGS